MKIQVCFTKYLRSSAVLSQTNEPDTLEIPFNL